MGAILGARVLGAILGAGILGANLIQSMILFFLFMLRIVLMERTKFWTQKTKSVKKKHNNKVILKIRPLTMTVRALKRKTVQKCITLELLHWTMNIEIVFYTTQTW